MQTTHRSCLGALLRKDRAWPPRWSQTQSEAPRLARQTQWQPRAWNKANLPSLCLSLCLGIGALLHADPGRAQNRMDTIGAGTLLLQGEDGESIEAPRVHTAVRMEVTGIVARVEVRQQFHNPSDLWVEGIYAFPLPENSAVDRMRMEIGERIVEGEIREKVEAQKLYEQARKQGQRASVVHQKRPNLFRTAVANIGPGESIDIVIGYLQIVDQDAGRYSLRFPLTVTPRYVPGMVVDEGTPLSPETPTAGLTLATGADDSSTLGDLHPELAHASVARQSVTFDIDVDAGVPLERIASAYHAIQVDRDGDRAHIRLGRGRIPPDRDFELAWTPVVHGEPATALFREHTEAGEHALLMFMPPQSGVRVTTPREVIFVIDTSGSMAGESIEQASAALLEGLDTLTPADRFTVLQFNSGYHALFANPVPATTEYLDQARRYVRSLRSTGGTEMLAVLNAALSIPEDGEHFRQVIFITDGAVGNEDQLMRAVRARLGSARLFTVGIGSAPNGHFMRKIAQMGRGTFTFIGSTSEVDERMSALLHKLTQPVLTDIEVHWPQGTAVEYAPAQVTDLYAGEPVVITARLQEPARGLLSITGNSAGPWARQISLDAIESRTGIATLWARNRIADLMDSRATGATADDIRAQVLPLALQYRLVSNYTSLVAVDRTPARADSELLATRRIASTKPQGLDWPATGYPATATPAQLHITIGALLLLLALCLLLIDRRPVATRV